MESTPRLYHTMVAVLDQHKKWLDVRHLKTLAWMMVGLIESGLISLTAWAPYTQSRAVYAQSTVRRFRRWLDNKRIKVHALYGPLIREALREWGQNTLYLALDTSMLWGEYCIIRLSVVYRGRAVPLVWKVLKHASSSVAFETYQALLDQATTLLPLGCKVVFLADRGFADTELMQHLSAKLGWHWRIRIKGNFLVHRPGKRSCKINRISLSSGQACFLHAVSISANRIGPVHLALARLPGSQEYWWIVSDEPTDLTTFDEYGFRFDIEENFLDDKSNGFQLESSLIRSAEALSRLCLVLAITTLYLVAQGTQVVAAGKRRWVDPHWFRGLSYLKIGWNWVKRALVHGYEMITQLRLYGLPDPDPAMASSTQFQNQRGPCFFIEFKDFASRVAS
jgi:hypothetical protein